MRIVSYKVAALVVVLTLGFIPLNAALGAGWLQVVAFGDSLLDAGTYSLFAERRSAVASVCLWFRRVVSTMRRVARV